MSPSDPISGAFVKTMPDEAVRRLQAIVRSGDVTIWRRIVAKDIDLSQLIDANLRTLMHIAVEAQSGGAMAKLLVEHCRANGSAVLDLINQPDSDGETPRSLAIRLDRPILARFLEQEGAVLSGHYDDLIGRSHTILLVDRTGRISEAELGTYPLKSTWALIPLRRLRRELAEINMHFPELAAAFASRNGSFVLTEGTVADYDRHIERKTGVAPRPEVVGNAASWAEDAMDHLVIVLNALLYAAHDPYVNVAAHELTHIADARTRVVQTKDGLLPRLGWGVHSEQPIFKLICELDYILEAETGIVGHNHVTVQAYENYRLYPALEYFARASDYVSAAHPPAVSPLMNLYREIILRPALEMQRDGQIARLTYLEKSLSVATPECLLGATLQKQLTGYRWACWNVENGVGKDPVGQEAVARAIMRASRSGFQDKLAAYMRTVMAGSDKAYGRAATLLPATFETVRSNRGFPTPASQSKGR